MTGGSICPTATLPMRSEVVLEDALLGRDLRGRLDVLHRAAATDAVPAAARRGSLGAGTQHLDDAPQVEVAAAAPAGEEHALAGHAAVDERHLAVDVRDADALVVDRLDQRLGGPRILRRRHRVSRPRSGSWASRTPGA
jgi:hypothetical protein